MRHYLGLSEYHFRQKKQNLPQFYEPGRLINGHLLLAGMSGTGKSWQSMRWMESAAQAGLELDVFDVHDELDGIAGATACRYSQATGYGFNPLELDTDPHTGGVNRQVDYLLNLLKSVTRQLGSKQEACLRHLLQDTYAMSGIWPDNANSWQRDRINETQRRQMVEARQWSQLRQFYPTLDDLMSFGRRKLQVLVIGGDNKSVSALDQLQKAFRRLSGLQGRFARGGSDDEREKLQKQIEGAKTQCVGQYTEFVENMQSGRELDDVLKYDSVDVLTSAMQRLELLNAAGIFRANPPPFGDSKVRVHQLKSLTAEQQVMFVKLRLQAIFDRCKRAGATRSGTELRQVVFLDEGHKYFSKEPDDIINVIAKEARKFGLGLWCASQSPTEFPEAFLTNVGATALLGIHSRYWPDAQRMLRCSEDTLHYTKPKEVITVKFQREGQADPPWQNIIVPNPGNPAGVAAAGFR